MAHPVTSPATGVQPPPGNSTTQVMQRPNPFKGPSAYKEGDKFFGREEDITHLYSIIRSELLTLLFSRSGIGKTSLLKAGLIPRLRNELNFLPVYIHLDSKGVENSSAQDLNDYVIRCCEKELASYALQFGADRVAITQSPRVKKNSLFEYIHNLRIILSDKPVEKNGTAEPAEADRYIIRPLLIFDQLEEILTQSFLSGQLEGILIELKCLLEDRIPSHLQDSFNGPGDPKYLELKSSLHKKQKDFRIVFSFREEYLPQFESLGKEFPAIRFTNSRYRLDGFSIPTAEEVIVLTDPNIPRPHAEIIATQVAINVSRNFSKVIVEPFLLSLVCQKIYHKICARAANPITDEEIEEIRQLVDDAIERYIDEVYAKIKESTRIFIEQKLVTADHRRTTFSYNQAINEDPGLIEDIALLVTDSQYRLLNMEDFFDSVHIEILHDRLLPPIAKRKEDRTRRAEEKALRDKQQQLEAANEQKRKELEKQADDLKNKRRTNRFIIASLLFGVLGFLMVSLVLRSNNIQAERDAKILDSAYKALHKQESELSISAENERSANKHLTSTKDSIRFLNDSLNRSAGILKSQFADLKTSKKKLARDKALADSQNQVLTATYDTLLKSKVQIEEEKKRKELLAEFFETRTDTLIEGLRRNKPFEALNVAVDEYQHLKEAMLNETAIIQDVKATILDIYNNTALFTTQPFSLGVSYSITPGRGLVSLRTGEGREEKFSLYKLSSIHNQEDPPHTTLSPFPGQPDDEHLTGSPGMETAPSILASCFSETGNFFFSITSTGKRDSIIAWTIDRDEVRQKPVFRRAITDFDISKTTLVADGRRYIRGDQLIYCAKQKKAWSFWIYDLASQRSRSFVLPVRYPDEQLYTVSADAKAILTRRTSNGGGQYTIHRRTREEESFQPYVLTAHRAIVNILFRGDSTVAVTSDSSGSTILIWNASGNVIDSIALPTVVDASGLFMSNGRIITVDRRSRSIVTYVKDIHIWRRQFSFPLQNYVPKNSMLGLTFSPDRNLLACNASSSAVVVFNLQTGRTLETFNLPDNYLRRTLVFSPDNNALFILENRELHTLYFQKGLPITDIDQLQQILNSNYYQGAWPVPKQSG
jgi:hypothetical protein